MIRAEREDAADFQKIFSESIAQLQSLSTSEPVRWYDLMRMVLTWAIWRRSQPERDNLLTLVKKQQSSTEKEKEIEKMTNQLGATIVDIARAEGELIASHRYLRSLLQEKFGSLPEDLEQKIDKMDDLERLQQAILQVLKIESLDELQL